MTAPNEPRDAVARTIPEAPEAPPFAWHSPVTWKDGWRTGYRAAIAPRDAEIERLRAALFEERARVAGMRERAAKVCDDRSAMCASAAKQWMEGEHPEPDIASSVMVGADQCEQAAAAIRALPLTEEAGHAER